MMFLKHEAKREGGRKGKEAEIEESRTDNWHSSSLLLLARPSPAECRTVAQLLAPIVSHKAGRNVWPALWETALQASQLLSRPRGLEFCHTGLNGDELAETEIGSFFFLSFFFFTPRWQTVRGCETKTRTGRADAVSLARSSWASFPSLYRHLNTHKKTMNKQIIISASPRLHHHSCGWNF